jgi:phosphomannomutase
MMRRLRAHPVDTLGGRRVLDRRDLLDGGGGLPATDAVVFTLDGGKAVVRPSGTEPKLKAYLEVVEPAGGDPVAGRRHAQQALLLIRGQLSAILEG